MSEEPSPERVLQNQISALLTSVLSDWERSADAINFAEPVVFPSGAVFNGMEKRNAAGAFKNGFAKGELSILVSTSVFDENLLTKTEVKKPEKDAEGFVVYTLFPANFNSECQKRGMEAKAVVQNALIDTLRTDAEISAKGLKRSASKVKGKVGILNLRK